MALLRDVGFLDYASSPAAAAACADLNRFGADFKGLKINGKVVPQTPFRDPLAGVRTGPYISQLLWMNTPFGVEFVERKMRTLLPDTDHVTDYGNWLAVEDGNLPESSAADFDPVRRYIGNGRDLAQWGHIDVLFQAYFNACLILLTPPSADPSSSGIGCPFNPGNPYVGNPTQIGFNHLRPAGHRHPDVRGRLLRYQRGCYNETFGGYTFTKFHGSTVTV